MTQRCVPDDPKKKRREGGKSEGGGGGRFGKAEVVEG
jgi:hypothetical protein